MYNLPKLKLNTPKRVGRGHGSGKGSHTVGRGVKGQKSRTKVDVLFQGTKMKKSLLKRLPFIRGKSRFKAKGKPHAVKMSDLKGLPDGSVVTAKLLVEKGIVSRKNSKYGVKIIGKSMLKNKITIETAMSSEVSKLISGSTSKDKSSK